MKCDICGTEVSQGSLIMGAGFVCSEDCGQIASGRIKAYHDQLKVEPLSQMPEVLETGDFERWSLKLAVQILGMMTDKQRQNVADNNPMMLLPETLALDLKDKILRHIPKCYVSEVQLRGHDRLFCDGEYCFRQPVPKDTIVEACRKAEILA